MSGKNQGGDTLSAAKITALAGIVIAVITSFATMVSTGYLLKKVDETGSPSAADTSGDSRADNPIHIKSEAYDIGYNLEDCMKEIEKTFLAMELTGRNSNTFARIDGYRDGERVILWCHTDAKSLIVIVAGLNNENAKNLLNEAVRKFRLDK